MQQPTEAMDVVMIGSADDGQTDRKRQVSRVRR